MVEVSSQTISRKNCDFTPWSMNSLYKELIIGFIVTIDKKNNIGYDPMTCENVEHSCRYREYELSGSSYAQTIENNLKVVGVVNAPFPTYKLSSYIGTPSESENSYFVHELYDLGYEFPGDKKIWAHYVKERVCHIIIEWDKKLSKDDPRLLYLNDCYNLCKKMTESHWYLDDQENLVTKL